MVRRTLVGMLCAFVLTLSACLKEKNETYNAKDFVQVKQPEKVLDYLALSAHFLINQQQPDGFFKYEYDFITGAYTHWDNVIHQTRAGYTLIQYYAFLVRNNIDSQLATNVLSSAVKALQAYTSASIRHNDMPGELISFYYNKSGVSTINSSKISDKKRNQRLEAEIAATAFALITEISYWSFTSDTSFASKRQEWRTALLHHAENALKKPSQKNTFMPYIWNAFAVYIHANPSDKEINEILPKIDAYFMTFPRYIQNAEDYTWDMIAANLRFQETQQQSFADFAARQTAKILENLYTQHDTSVNSCGLSLGLVEASLILTGKSGDYTRIEQTALGRSQLEYYSSLKHIILPNQAWIALGPGRTLHSQDFKRFAGASIFGRHHPSSNIGLTEMCLLTGMRFSNEDIKELKQKTGKE